MRAERCYVCVQLNGTTHFYQRECEVSVGVAKPYFVPENERPSAATMPEEVAMILVEHLRKLGGSPWLIDAKTGRRIDVPNSDAETSYGDDRKPCAATLDDVNWFLVTPICRPSGRCWFVKAVLPGPTNPQVFYGNTPLEALQRAGLESFAVL